MSLASVKSKTKFQQVGQNEFPRTILSTRASNECDPGLGTLGVSLRHLCGYYALLSVILAAQEKYLCSLL